MTTESEMLAEMRRRHEESGTRTELHGLGVELVQLRAEVARLRADAAKSDLVHIRLRAGLREALELMRAHDAHRGVCDDNVATAEHYAQLEALVVT